MEDTQSKLIKCLKHTFYVWGITLFPQLIANFSNLTPETINGIFISSLLTAGSAFFIAYRVIFKSDIIEEILPKNMGKKGNSGGFSVILLA